jgi:hypothetical protein
MRYLRPLTHPLAATLLASHCALFATSTTATAAQNPRPSVQIDSSTAGVVAPSITSNGVLGGNLSAILYEDGLTNTIWASTSDGRGISWNTPLRVDDDITGAKKIFEWFSIQAATNGKLYACWRDERNSVEDDLYFAVNAGGGWLPNIMLDKGYAVGANPVRNFAFDSEGDFVAVLIATDNGDEELYLVVSTDGGATFTSALGVTSHNGAADIDAVSLDIEDSLVHIAWADNYTSTSDNVYYAQYDLGLAAFTQTDVLVSANIQAAGGDVDDAVNISASGPNVAIAMQADNIGGTTEGLWVNVMINGAFTGDQSVGAYTLGSNDVDNPAILMKDLTTVIVTWEDDRLFIDEVFAATADFSVGSTFNPDTQLSTGGGGFPRISGDGDYVGISFSAGSSTPHSVGAAVSRDGGTTFGAGFTVADTTGDADDGEIAFNALYGNFICAWLSNDLGVNHLYAGGFRSQTVTPVGTFSAGNPVHLDASGFGASEDGNFFGVAISGSTGSYPLPLGDGRDTGLMQDPYLNWSLTQIPGSMTGSLSNGSGSTPTLSLPPIASGTTLYFVGVGFDANPSIYSLTDVSQLTIL